MELTTCPRCEKVFLGDRERKLCPICTVIEKADQMKSQSLVTLGARQAPPSLVGAAQ